MGWTTKDSRKASQYNRLFLRTIKYYYQKKDKKNLTLKENKDFG